VSAELGVGNGARYAPTPSRCKAITATALQRLPQASSNRSALVLPAPKGGHVDLHNFGDAFNFFLPFRRLEPNHENQLTRALPGLA
jgi:hypothetical protein